MLASQVSTVPGQVHSANRAAKVLRMAAMSLGRSDRALGAFYRRLAAHVGKTPSPASP